MCIGPYEDGPLDRGEARASLAKWRELLGKYTNKEKFQEFLETV